MFILIFLVILDATYELLGDLNNLQDLWLIWVSGLARRETQLVESLLLSIGLYILVSAEVVAEGLVNKLVKLDVDQPERIRLVRLLEELVVILLNLRDTLGFKKTWDKKDDVHVLIQVSLAALEHHFLQLGFLHFQRVHFVCESGLYFLHELLLAKGLSKL